MKRATSWFLLLALLSCNCDLGQASIGELYRDFYEVANIGKVKDLLENRLEAGDQDVARVVDYLKSPDFRTIYNYMWDGNNTRELYDWFSERGVPLDDYFIWLHNFLNWEDFRNPPSASDGSRSRRSLSTLAGEVERMVSLQRVLAWTYTQFISNPDMAQLISKLNDESSHSVWRRLYASPEFLSVRCRAIQEGVEVRTKERGVCEFLGWKRDDCQSPECNDV